LRFYVAVSFESVDTDLSVSSNIWKPKANDDTEIEMKDDTDLWTEDRNTVPPISD